MYKEQIGGGRKSKLTQLILPRFPLTIAARDEPNNQRWFLLPPNKNVFSLITKQRGGRKIRQFANSVGWTKSWIKYIKPGGCYLERIYVINIKRANIEEKYIWQFVTWIVASPFTSLAELITIKVPEKWDEWEIWRFNKISNHWVRTHWSSPNVQSSLSSSLSSSSRSQEVSAQVSSSLWISKKIWSIPFPLLFSSSTL